MSKDEVKISPMLLSDMIEKYVRHVAPILEDSFTLEGPPFRV